MNMMMQRCDRGLDVWLTVVLKTGSLIVWEKLSVSTLAGVLLSFVRKLVTKAFVSWKDAPACMGITVQPVWQMN